MGAMHANPGLRVELAFDLGDGRRWGMVCESIRSHWAVKRNGIASTAWQADMASSATPRLPTRFRTGWCAARTGWNCRARA